MGKLVGLTKANDAMKHDYNQRAATLKEWVEQKTEALNDRTFDNTLADAQNKLAEFNGYKTNEKVSFR